jgi:hypothetical protein
VGDEGDQDIQFVPFWCSRRRAPQRIDAPQCGGVVLVGVDRSDVHSSALVVDQDLNERGPANQGWRLAYPLAPKRHAERPQRLQLGLELGVPIGAQGAIEGGTGRPVSHTIENPVPTRATVCEG